MVVGTGGPGVVVVRELVNLNERLTVFFSRTALTVTEISKKSKKAKK